MRKNKSKYSDLDIEKMEELRYRKGYNVHKIGKIFGVSGRAIENQLYERGGAQMGKPLRVPNFSGWDFSEDNICEY